MTDLQPYREQIMATLHLSEDDRSQLETTVQQVIAQNRALAELVERANHLKDIFPGSFTLLMERAIAEIKPEDLDDKGIHEVFDEEWQDFTESSVKSTDTRLTNLTSFILSRVNVTEPNIVLMNFLESEDESQSGGVEIITACAVDISKPTQEVNFYLADSNSGTDIEEGYRQVEAEYIEKFQLPN